MIKILHTSDWHLGKKLNQFSRHEEQEQVLQEIVEKANEKEVDLVIIAGDIFDAYNPPNESIELFYRKCYELSKNGLRPVVVIAGNHDSAEKIEAPEALASVSGITFQGFPDSKIKPTTLRNGTKISCTHPGLIKIQLHNNSVPIKLILSPYASQARLQQKIKSEDLKFEFRKVIRTSWHAIAEKHLDRQSINILVTHYFMLSDSAKQIEEPLDEKQTLYLGGAEPIYVADIPDAIDYTALGHIHSFQNLNTKDKPVIYSGSILNYNFHETNPTKYISLVEFDDAQKTTIKKIELKSGKKLKKKTCNSVLDSLSWLEKNQESFVELSVATDNYLSAEDKLKIMKSHPRIVSLIPKPISEDKKEEKGINKIDETKGVLSLFKDFFERKTRQTPDESLIQLFGEIASENYENLQ